MVNIIYEIEKLVNERELYYSRYIEAENARRKLEKQVSQYESLQVKVSKFESELSEKCIEIEKYKATCCSMQMEIEKLQKERKEYVINMAEIRTLKMELEEQNRLLKNEIDDYKRKNESFDKRDSSNQRTMLSAKRFVCTHSENTRNAVQKESDIDKLIKKLDKLEELITNNEGRNVYNISIAKADQLNGLLESGSQVIHTNYK